MGSADSRVRYWTVHTQSACVIDDNRLLQYKTSVLYAPFFDKTSRVPLPLPSLSRLAHTRLMLPPDWTILIHRETTHSALSTTLGSSLIYNCHLGIDLYDVIHSASNKNRHISYYKQAYMYVYR